MKKPKNPKLGSAYRVTSSEAIYRAGTIVYLVEDDKSSCPWFSSDKTLDGCHPGNCHIVSWSNLEPLDQPEKKHMKLKKLENTVVHCKTQTEYDELMRIYEDAGWVWRNGDKPTNHKSYFSEYEDGICAKVEDRFTKDSVRYWKLKNWKIISLSEFKRIQGLEREFRVGDRVRVVAEDSKFRVKSRIGQEGVIESDDKTNVPFVVRYPDGDYDWKKACNIELITPVEETTCSSTTEHSFITVDDVKEAYYSMLTPRFYFRPVYKDWMIGDWDTTTTGKQPKKGTFMSKLKNIPELLLAGLDPAKRNYYKLGWIATDDELKLYVTTAGREADLVCRFLEDGDLPAYAASEVKRIEAEEKAAKKAKREEE